MLVERRMSRRGFLGMTAALFGAGMGLGVARCDPRLLEPQLNAGQAGNPSGDPPLSWVWQFASDGHPATIRNALASRNAGILLKTHDGIDWMSKYDRSIYAVSGPAQVEVLADYFEERAVPFHAWCVVHGLDPDGEAAMAAEVLAAGARSIHLDFEPHAGFWRGDAAAAQRLGRQLRRRFPQADVWLSIDPRPWQIARLPIAAIAPYVTGFSPQVYWETFIDNVNKYRESGYDPGPSGITPEFVLEVTYDVLRGYGLPLYPVGQGASTNLDKWRRFLGYSATLRTPMPSIWRFGVTSDAVWQVVLDPRSRQPLPRIDLKRLASATPTPTPKPVDLAPVQTWGRSD